MNDESECWRPVPEWPRYEVSDVGRVRVAETGRVLQGRVRRRDGYREVRLYRDGSKAMHKVHRLVLSAFSGPRPSTVEARHLNGQRADNRLSNLRWGSRAENMRDQVAHGNHAMARRSACPRGHALSLPNLVASDWRSTRRRCCLSCNRARAKAGRLSRAGQAVDFQALSDDYYRRLSPAPVEVPA